MPIFKETERMDFDWGQRWFSGHKEVQIVNQSQHTLFVGLFNETDRPTLKKRHENAITLDSGKSAVYPITEDKVLVTLSYNDEDGMLQNICFNFTLFKGHRFRITD